LFWSKKHGIGRLTICDIKHKEVELKGYYRNMKEMGMVQEAKVMKCGKDIELDLTETGGWNSH